jgi:hypothetical protein
MLRHRTMIRILLLATAVLLAALLIPGCGFLNFLSTNENRDTSTGRDLIDLKEARDKNIISYDEYVKLRAKVLKDELGDDYGKK